MNKKGLALLSGGLDSTLAIKIIIDQGIEVEAINFVSPFCTCDKKDGCRHEAKHMSDLLGVPLKVMSTGMEYIEIIKNPKFGYGKNLNPCIDCRIFMFKKAKEYLKEIGASFFITGEVLGQRPKSQRKDAMRIIEREAGLKGLILRPLSAKALPPTIPEEMGIVNRENLLGVIGRGRKDQIALAKKFNIENYLCAGGGCLLTDKNFVGKLKDSFEHNEDTTQKKLILLRIGRHFRSSTTKSKIIVGRDDKENLRLKGYVTDKDFMIHLSNERPGPLVVILGEADESTQKEAAELCAYYAKSESITEVVSHHNNSSKIITVKPASADTIEKLKIA